MTNSDIVPAPPRHVLIGHDAHEAMAAALHRDRPDLEIRHSGLGSITLDDLVWADAYLGFRRPAQSNMGNIRWVHSTGAGVDPWFYPDELPREILLTRSSESFGPMIAEWALARALAFTQSLIALEDSQRAGKWEKLDVPHIAGTTALVVGTGDVGGHVGKLFRAVGCNVEGVSRSAKGDAAIFSKVWPVDEINQAVTNAQWLIVMLPLTNESRGVISRDVLRHCNGAVLMNAGRGPVVEESAIPEALENGWLRGAALDVFETEPLPADSPLWNDRRVMISPHIAGLTTVEGAVAGFVEVLGDLESGRTPKWKVERGRQY